MNRLILSFGAATLLLCGLSTISVAQQFIGADTREHSAIQHMASNPAWVVNAKTGKELMFFSVNALAGTNAYSFNRKFIFKGFNGQAIEDEDYIRDPSDKTKHMWANVEINGPAISFVYKKEHYIGAFTRMRQLYRGGNINSTAFQLMGQETPDDLYATPIEFNNAGFSTHTFAEVGVTYGREIRNDYYNVIRGGVSLKYMMGFVAGSVYTESLQYKADSNVVGINGDLTALYTHNIPSFVDTNAQNDLTSWFRRAGRAGLGIDIGAQYEYHPNGNPNNPTPYMFSIAASITDVGGIGYIADTGSGSYNLAINGVDTARIKKSAYEEPSEYLLRMDKDTLLGKGEKEVKFRMGLPTAFRLNADYNASDKFNMALNVLLNMRGNGGSRYKSAYVSYINFTPSYRIKHLTIGLPFTVMGYQTITAGANFRIGPVYFGSSSVLSMLLAGNKIKNIDGYMGVAWKFRSKEKTTSFLRH